MHSDSDLESFYRKRIEELRAAFNEVTKDLDIAEIFRERFEILKLKNQIEDKSEKEIVTVVSALGNAIVEYNSLFVNHLLLNLHSKGFFEAAFEGEI